MTCFFWPQTRTVRHKKMRCERSCTKKTTLECIPDETDGLSIFLTAHKMLAAMFSSKVDVTLLSANWSLISFIIKLASLILHPALLGRIPTCHVLVTTVTSPGDPRARLWPPYNFPWVLRGLHANPGGLDPRVDWQHDSCDCREQKIRRHDQSWKGPVSREMAEPAADRQTDTRTYGPVLLCIERYQVWTVYSEVGPWPHTSGSAFAGVANVVDAASCWAAVKTFSYLWRCVQRAHFHIEVRNGRIGVDFNEFDFWCDFSDNKLCQKPCIVFENGHDTLGDARELRHLALTLCVGTPENHTTEQVKA